MQTPTRTQRLCDPRAETQRSPGRLYKRYITWWHQSARRRRSCQVPGTGREQNQTQGAGGTALWPPMPEQGRALAAPALFLPAPSTPEDTEGDLPGSAFLFPRRAAGRGASTLAPWPRQPLSSCPSPRGARGGPWAGEARGPAAPSSLSLHRNVWGTGAAAAPGLAGPAFPLLCHLPFL